MVPLVNKALRDLDWVPAPVRGRLETSCRTIVAHNLSLALELVGVLQGLEQSAIKAAPFKGPVWTKILYGNLADRQIADLDLFIEKSEVPQASRVLSDRGYAKVEPCKGVPLSDTKDVEFFHPKTGIHLELHWSACEAGRDPRLARAKFWIPDSTATLPHCDVPLPSAQNIFFLLAIHGFRHNWESLKWLCDIAAFVQVHKDLDWDGVLFEAAKLSRKRLILLPLALVEQLLQVKLPSPIARAIARDSIVSRIATEIQRRNYTVQADDAVSRSRTALERMYLEWVRVQVRDGVFERLGMHSRFLFGLIKPNEKDRSLFDGKLPEPIYWILRPYRLFRRDGPAKFVGFSRRFATRSAPPAPPSSSG